MDRWTWVSTTDPLAMLQSLSGGTLSRRKARLLAAASCRRIWHLLTDRRSREAVEAAERLADEQEDAPPSGASHAAYPFQSAQEDAADCSRQAAALAADPDSVEHVLYYATRAAALARASHLSGEWTTQMEQGRAASCALIRDLFGSLPRRRPAIPRPLWVWNDSVVRRLAEEAYGKRQLPSGQLDNAVLGVLADALEEAGVTDQEVLGHLRRPEAVHVKGCFVLDWLLEKM